MHVSLDRFASRVADRIIHRECEHAARTAIADSLMAIFGFHRVGVKARRRRIKPNWTARDRFLSPYEKRVMRSLRAIWDSERRIILANMKKYPMKGMATKEGPGPIDNWLYPSGLQAEKISTALKRELGRLLAASIERATADLGANVDIAFEVVNDRALGWLAEYTPKLSANLEAVNTADLRAALTEGMESGEGMDKLRARVNDVFDEYDKVRAERIARTETIRAQEQANIETYREAGFERKVWIANQGCCDICQALDDTDVPIDEEFIDINGNGHDAPPAHPNCRCSSSGWDEDWND